MIILYIICIFIGVIIGAFIMLIKKNLLEKSLSELQATNNYYTKRIADLETITSNLNEENKALNIEKALLKEREKHLLEMRNSIHKEFEAISLKILEENRMKFTEETKFNLSSLLDPVKTNLQEFKQKIEENHLQDNIDRATLKTQIENIVKTNNQLNLQAENLTKALKGDNKTQGNWGEIHLEMLLEASGLVKHIDYIAQGANLNLLNENDKIQRPDIIILLPENKQIIIDAKVSLLSYEKYINSENIEEQKSHLKDFLLAIKNQINNLSKKSYNTNEKIYSPDYTIMYMPIEAAYILAVSSDNNLHQEAWNKKIVLVSSSTLFAILKTVAHVIAADKRNKNAEEIAKQASDMYDKFVTFQREFETIGKSIDKAKSSFENATNLLYTGKGNLIARADKLKELGITPKKKLNTTINNLNTTEDDIPLENLAE